MGQKSHPIALRLQKTNRRFESLWYTQTKYHDLLTQQFQVQGYLEPLFQDLSLSTGSLSLILSAKKSQILLSYFDTREARQEKGIVFSSKSGVHTPFRQGSPLLFQRLKVKKVTNQTLDSFGESRSFLPTLHPDERGGRPFSFQNRFFFALSRSMPLGSEMGEGAISLTHQKDGESLSFGLERQMWPFSALQKTGEKGDTVDFQNKRFLWLFLFFALFQPWEERASFSRLLQELSLYTFFQECRLSALFQKKRTPLSTGTLSFDPLVTVESPTSLWFLEALFQSALSRPFWVESWKGRAESQSAGFLAAELAFFLEKRISFRRLKSWLLRDLEENKDGRWSRVNGVRVTCSGRVGGSSGKKAQRARKEGFQWGETSLHVFSSKVDYSQKSALTGFGQVGVKVWICYTESLP